MSCAPSAGSQNSTTFILGAPVCSALFENTEAADYEELWHLADGSNIRVLARPHPHGALAFTFDDVTERMRLEQRYRHSIDLRRATLNGPSQGIAVFGANGLLQFVNQAFHEIWGTDPDAVHAAMHARQLIGVCEEIAVDPEVWQKLYAFITGEESRRSWSTRLTTNTGHELTARFAPLPDGSTLAAFTEITDFERVSEALLDREVALEMAEAARAALEELVGGGSGPALDASDSTAGAPAGTGTVPDHDGRGDAGSASAAQFGMLVGQATWIAAQPLDPCEDREPGNVADALSYANVIVAPRARQTGVSLCADPAEAPGRVLCPAGRLRQIAFQLASAALDRSQPGSRVVLRAGGIPESFFLEAECSAAACLKSGPGSRADPLSRLSQLASRQGWRIEVEQAEPGCQARLSCRFESRRPERDDGAPAPGGPLPDRIRTICALQPKLG